MVEVEKIQRAYPKIAVVSFSEIDSTNTEARRRIQEQGVQKMLILSESQSAGRGRQGKSFFSPKGSGIYMTLVYPMDAEIFQAVKMTGKASVSVYKGISEQIQEGLSIKWVNDIYLQDKKVAGILVESVLEGTHVNGLIIGIGINISTEDFPKELEQIAISLSCAGKIDETQLVSDIVKNLLFELEHLQDSSYLEVYRQKSNVLGKEIEYTENGIQRHGKAVTINDDGALVLITAQGEEVILQSGEITIRRCCS